MTNFVKNLQNSLLRTDLLNRLAVHETKCEKSGSHAVKARDQAHLKEAIDWFIRAAKAIPSGGISRGYSFGWNPYFPKRGWQPAHPRSTGEAIGTFFDCAASLDRDDLHTLAIASANWLIKIQMLGGAIRGGALDEPPSSEVLNTTAAILAWTRTYRETGTERFALAARRGCDFLLQVQDSQARGKENATPDRGYADAMACAQAGLALIQAGIALEEYRYCAAGEKSVARSLCFQQPNGWFRSNCPDGVQQPLLQSIAGCVDGILQIGLILEEEKYLKAARKTAHPLLNLIGADGRMSGRFGGDWSEQVGWSCLAGEAKMTALWLKLHQTTGEKKYLEAAQKAIKLLKCSQNCKTSIPGLRGGIKGSFPCDGECGHYQVLSGATVRFIDALLLHGRLMPEQGSLAGSRTRALG